METTNTNTLAVPGARIFYRVQGAGPILLLIAGGGGDADSFDGLAGSLTGRFSVVTYDRRGYARSPREDPHSPVEIGTHSEDAYRILEHVDGEPAFVFGASIGALIGLDLALRHPGQVRRLVAHEPPVRQLLSPAEDQPPLFEMYREDGAAAALEQFAASIGVQRGDLEGQPGREKPARGSAQNMEAFFQVDAPAAGRYRLDIDALQGVAGQVVVAGGVEGREYFPYLCAARLAERLGQELMEFPGNHAGFVTQPREFGAKLVQIFNNL